MDYIGRNNKQTGEFIMRRSLAVIVIASFLLSGCASNDGSHFDSRTDSATLPVFVLAAALLGGAIAASH